MAGFGHRETFLDNFRRGSPILWLLTLSAAMPWIRVVWQGWTIYPGHWLLSLLLLNFLWRQPIQRGGGARLALKAGLVLGLYICLMAGLRGQWWLLAVTIGVLLLNYGWGLAAWRIGMATAGTGSFPEGLLLLLAGALVMGFAGWAAAFFYPPLCLAVGCPPLGVVPYPFLAGWTSQGQYLVFLLTSLPVAGMHLLLLSRAPHRTGGRLFLMGLLVASAMGLMAGARIWVLAVAVLAVAGAVWRLVPLAIPGEQRLAKAMALAAALSALVIYGLSPGYLSVAARGPTGGALLRVTYPQPPPVRLSSETDTPIPIELTNAGLITLPGGGETPARIGARLLITPEQSRTRAIDVASLALTQPLAPGRSITVEMTVRLPHWAREGYLAWRVDSGGGEAARLAADSEFGFRFINRSYRNLAQERGNFVTALSERAANFGQRTFTPRASERSAQTAGDLTGRLSDTLVFSPLWGLGHGGESRRHPFPAQSPFWLLLFQEYGAIGLGLGLWFAVSLLRRAHRIAAHSIRVSDRIVWRLIPLSALAVLLTGIFSSDIGQFHGIWGLFLLSGFIEGRHEQLFGRRTPAIPTAKRRKWFGFLRWPRRPRGYAPPMARKRRRWRN